MNTSTNTAIVRSSDATLNLAEHASPLTPRDHQIAAWDRLAAHYGERGHSAGLVVIPTGGGKTVLGAQFLLASHIREGGRVLWLAQRRSLLHQAFGTFRRLGNVAFPKSTLRMVAVSSDDASWSQVGKRHDVAFASLQSSVLENNRGFVDAFLEDAGPAGTFVVVDEAHHAPAPSYGRLLKHLKRRGAKLLGLTATPVRTDPQDQRRLSAIFDGNIVYRVSRRELTERGILAAPVFETVSTNVDLERDFTAEDITYLKRRGELAPQVLARLAKHAKRNDLIVQHWLKKREVYGPTIVFAADTLHAQTLADAFRARGVDADYVDYSRRDAQLVMARYQAKKGPQVLINVEMLTEGFDAPHTRTVFIARPTRSESLLVQMVGRALRGPKSGGNDRAYLVTFLDTWRQYDVLDAEHVLAEPDDSDKPTATATPSMMVPIPPELVREAYRLLQSNVRGTLTGVHQCLPYGWFAWEETFDDDQQRRTVMIFDNQREGFERLLADYAASESVPAELHETAARALVKAYFEDVPDPLPRWSDVMALLEARRKGCEIHAYTFEEKNEIDPRVLARAAIDQAMTPTDEQAYLRGIWETKSACRAIYRADFRALVEEVSREKIVILTDAMCPIEPQVAAALPVGPPRGWEEGAAGHSLIAARDAVFAQKRHFPEGPPKITEITWSKQPLKRLFGFYRHDDRRVVVNVVLDSPDVPPFVVEFLVFHELLHAAMPTAGHNREFRQRERGFVPSAAAIADANERGIAPREGASRDYWRVRADMFLDGFAQRFAMQRPGSVAID
jgi:superfamily II DNA or RNA helicase